ncbi:40S ribosomal protein S5-1 [Hordeum vulgare]|nr:40S ribosomal protein S5-1 [Hordeum vulgare]
MHEVVLHIHDVEDPKKTGSMEARIEAMQHQVFKCQGMVERGLNANHMMITEFTNKLKIDANDIGKHLSRLYYRIDHLQAQIYDLQNKNSAAIPVAQVEELRHSLADVRSKHDEVAGERDELQKELSTEQAAMAMLKAEVERLASVL